MRKQIKSAIQRSISEGKLFLGTVVSLPCDDTQEAFNACLSVLKSEFGYSFEDNGAALEVNGEHKGWTFRLRFVRQALRPATVHRRTGEILRLFKPDTPDGCRNFCHAHRGGYSPKVIQIPVALSYEVGDTLPNWQPVKGEYHP